MLERLRAMVHNLPQFIPPHSPNRILLVSLDRHIELRMPGTRLIKPIMLALAVDADRLAAPEGKAMAHMDLHVPRRL